MSTLSLHFENESQATRWAMEWLESHADGETLRNAAIARLVREGYGVVKPLDRFEWLTQKELLKRHAPRLSLAGLHYRLHSHRAPYFLADRGTSGRIVKIVPNPTLIEFLNEPQRPGRRTDLATEEKP